MANTTGLDMNSAMLFQLITETTAGTYASGGVRYLMTSLRVEEQPETAFDKFKPNGFNDVAWTAMTREHRVLSGPVRLDFAQIGVLMSMMFGAAVSDDTVSTVRTLVYELPSTGAVTRQSYTGEYGLVAKAARMPFVLLQSLSLNFMRMTENSEGAVTLIARKPTSENAAMTGLGGGVTVPEFIPILPQMWTTRREAVYADLDDSDPLEKVSGFTADAPDQVIPLWHQSENNYTWTDYVDGDNELKFMVTIANDTDGTCQAIVDESRAVPSTPMWWQFRAAHPSGDYILKIEGYFAVGENIPFSVDNNVRYRQFPLIAHLNSEGVRLRVTVIQPDP